MATRTVFTTADDQDNDKQHDHDEGDEPKHLHPAWCAGRGLAVGPRAGVDACIRVGGRVSHVGVLLCRAWAGKLVATAKFTRQYVDVNPECLV
jgi:hypothetical protein